MKAVSTPQILTITALAHTGQGVGTLANGKKAFVWGTLPGETVAVSVTMEHARYVEAELQTMLRSSPDRVAPPETYSSSTSPWQHMSFAAENRHKMQIVRELLRRSNVATEDVLHGDVQTDGVTRGYRNKIQYRLMKQQNKWAIAVYERGSHQPVPTQGDDSALPQLNTAAQAICRLLDEQQVPKNTYSMLTLRGSPAGKTVAALRGNRLLKSDTSLPDAVHGLCVDRPTSSRALLHTRTIQQIGSLELSAGLLGRQFSYDIHSFFQINLPVYEQALQEIRNFHYDKVVDMYAGVGSIGLSVATKSAVLVEPDTASVRMARKNSETTPMAVEIVEGSAEKSLSAISPASPLIVDPPRAGLHRDVVERCIETKPPAIIYLSCNPITQLRDIERLTSQYYLKKLTVYNFFPRTPHVETLAILQRRI